jgi:hypothetical protein
LYALFLPFSAALFCFIVLSAFNFKRFSSISASVVANLLQPLPKGNQKIPKGNQKIPKGKYQRVIRRYQRVNTKE